MARYESLPDNFAAARPVLERILTEQAARNQNEGSSRRRPDPPRSLLAQAGTAKCVLTWVGPQNMRGIVGWRVYVENENLLFKTINDVNERKVEIPLSANQSKAAAVSSWNGKAESIKVPIILTSDSNQFVVNGTGGATAGTSPGPPPEWEFEPRGGDWVENA